MSRPIQSFLARRFPIWVALSMSIGLPGPAQALAELAPPPDSLPSSFAIKDSARAETSAPSDRKTPADPSLPYQGKPRILILDPVVAGGDSSEGRKFAMLLASRLAKDGRTIPYRPLSTGQRDASLRAHCSEETCARNWFLWMPLEQVWFGSMVEDAGGARLHLRALGAKDSVVAEVDLGASGRLSDRAWQIGASGKAVETLLSGATAKRTLRLDGGSDRKQVATAFAQEIARKEEQYRSRKEIGRVVAVAGVGALVFGGVVWAVNSTSCSLANFEIDLGLSGAEDMSPEEKAEHDRQVAEEARSRDREMAACKDRSIGKPLMAVGAGAIVAGLVTLTSAATLSEELRDLKRQARASGVSLTPYIHPASGSPGVFAQVRF